MTILKKFENKIDQITQRLIAKNKKSARKNKLKLFIRSEKKVMKQLYLELGKYHYDHFRNENEKNAEMLCESIDRARYRLYKAQNKLCELNGQEEKRRVFSKRDQVDVQKREQIKKQKVPVMQIETEEAANEDSATIPGF